MRHISAVLTLLVAAGSVAAQDRTVASRSDAKLREAEENYRLGEQAADSVPKDYAAAARYYRKAADQGYIPAQYNLAYLYENGLGVKQDYAQAAAWYRKAADQGDPEAQNNLGTLYSTGQGVPRNDGEAVKLYRSAAAQDDLEGLTNLASMYLQGRGLDHDPAQALQLFTQAAERGSAIAQNNLALMYAAGQAGKRDYIQAYAWLDLAAAEIPQASRVRETVAKQMTPSQLSQARQLGAQKRKDLTLEEGRKP
jgi:hypothetical protein